MNRKPYHRTKQRIAQSASGARTLQDAARRLALRCGLLQPGQRCSLYGDGALWTLRIQNGPVYAIDLTIQDFHEVTP